MKRAKLRLEYLEGPTAEKEFLFLTINDLGLQMWAWIKTRPTPKKIILELI